MNKVIPVAIVCLLAGFAAAYWLPTDEPAAPPADAPAPATFDDTLPLAERVQVLERAISEERQARQLLQEELVYLTGELERVRSRAAAAPDSGGEVDLDSIFARERVRMARRNSPERRMERLIEAGFAEDRATWILRRESQLQMEAMQARYDAQQSGNMQAWFEAQRERAQPLRTELGEVDYERYLEASGRTTSVSVSSVMSGSPAERAGLRPGDEIISYAGERVYDMGELHRSTYDGQPGETVIVEVMRNGTRVHISMPRGPVGIMGGGSFRR